MKKTFMPQLHFFTYLSVHYIISNGGPRSSSICFITPVFRSRNLKYSHKKMGLCKLQSTLSALLCLNSLLAMMIPHSLAQNNPQDYLDAHNTVRAQVGVGPMTWDNEVAAYAHKYANQRVGDCDLVHSEGPYGENLAIGGAGTDAINMWVSEKPYYDYNSNSCKGDECLHYTQVVWRESVRLGCARLKCHKDNEEFFVICSYDPPGNIEGLRPY